MAEAYANSPRPFTDTMAALEEQFGRSHLVALQRIDELTHGSSIRSGDQEAFRFFALKIRALVGQLEQVGREGEAELQSGYHVNQLLRKIPLELETAFQKFIYPKEISVPTLRHLAEWLEFEVEVQAENEYTPRAKAQPSTGTPTTGRPFI